ncbi:hypothetical protein CROQUDRAFT_79660 [Cronartium quercuum f. sp. fusiforme G11]|uniref:intramembrane prenyl-peptidase Rce1 n=1 Tax=Cronartium quercuum f. sp. fusiforme G11 TaxID=708437 RepID=A0A9P6TBK6_9BASI|nr:hypothetical protein CROQUDRAFT_79660 [Cronartium quercuum f. sp. fusiforme G11]
MSLPPDLAFLVSGTLAVSYVAILYILPAARSKPWEKDPKTGQPRDRQHPAVIRARVLAVILITFLSLLGIGGLVKRYGGKAEAADPIEATLRLTGFRPSATVGQSTPFAFLRLQFQALLLTATLFLGPLYAQLLPSSSYQHAFTWSDYLELQTLRNLVIGPISEEIVYRGCIIATYFLIDPLLRPSASQIIFLSPLWFGAAHVHSIREIYISNGRTKRALVNGCLIAAFQFVYTTLFGWYASFIHLRTGSVIAASLCHSFCNMMGVPRFMDSMRKFPHRRLSIAISYISGMVLFAIGVRVWATNRNLFPSSNPLWWDLR